MFQSFKQLNFQTWLLLVFLYFNRLGFFVSVPYLVFYLSYLKFTPLTVGGIVASQALAYSLSGIPAGYLGDTYGKKNVMVYSLIFTSVICVALSHMGTALYYYIFNILLGLSRSLFDAAMPAYLTDITAKEAQRFIFNLRFIIINIAGATGPLLGIYFANRHSLVIFEISGLVFFLSAVIMIWQLQNDHKRDELIKIKKINFQDMLSILSRDKILLLLVLATLIYWFTYMQLEAPLAQVLEIRNPTQATWLYGLMWFINTLIIVFLQMPFSMTTKKVPLWILAYAGSVLLIIAFVSLAIYTGTDAFIVSIVLVTFGEMLLSPISNIVIANIAPAHLRSSYFGALALASIGTGISPIVGGLLLQYSNSEVLFLFTAFFIILSMLCYRACLPRDLRESN